MKDVQPVASGQEGQRREVPRRVPDDPRRTAGPAEGILAGDVGAGLAQPLHE